MKKIINFINSSGPYKNIVDSMIIPIKLHLPDSIVSSKPREDGINIRFFRNKDGTNIGTNIFMSHGIADKRWRDGINVKHFDYICVSGPLWVEKMIKEGIAREKILLTGYPKLDPIFQEKIKRNSSPTKVILWAPTHSNTSSSSYPAFKEYLNKLPSEFAVISAYHPYNKEEKAPTLQQLVDSDIVISDSGSLLYEAWAIGKPVIFPDWLIKDAVYKYFPNSFEDKIFREKIGYHADTIEQLNKQIYLALENKLDDKVINFIEGILPVNMRGKSGETSARILSDIK